MQTRNTPSIRSLHRLASQAGVQNYELLAKPLLYSKLKDTFNLDRLHRLARRSNKKRSIDDDLGDIMTSSSSSSSFSFSSSSYSLSASSSSTSKSSSSSSSAISTVRKNQKKRKRVSSIRNTEKSIDPILLVPVQKTKAFKYLRPNGTEVSFNIESLVDYILTTGNFADPVSRLNFTDQNLKDMDQLIIKLGLKKPSVYNAKYQNIQQYTDQNFHRDAVLGLERCAGEVITTILYCIENYDAEEAQMRLFLREFPLFADFFQQLRDADREFALQCLSHWRQFLQGPPNKKTKDTYGVLRMTLSFLSELESQTLSSNQSLNDDEEDDYESY